MITAGVRVSPESIAGPRDATGKLGEHIESGTPTKPHSAPGTDRRPMTFALIRKPNTNEALVFPTPKDALTLLEQWQATLHRPSRGVQVRLSRNAIRVAVDHRKLALPPGRLVQMPGSSVPWPALRTLEQGVSIRALLGASGPDIRLEVRPGIARRSNSAGQISRVG